MLDEDHLCCAEQLLRDDYGAERIFGIGTCVADYVGIAEIDAESGGRVDTSVHASHLWDVSDIQDKGDRRNIPTVYFFAGGRTKAPDVNFEAYSLLLSTRFCWMVVGAILKIT